MDRNPRTGKAPGELSPGITYVIDKADNYEPRARVRYLTTSLMMKRMARDRLLSTLDQVETDLAALDRAVKAAVKVLEAGGP